MISSEDKRMIKYFIQEKEDITRWTSWKDKKEEIGREYPELIFALDNLEMWKRILHSILEGIEDD